MSRELPNLVGTVVDSLEFARDGGVLDGMLKIADLPRLADVLAATGGNLAVRLEGQRVIASDGGRSFWLILAVEGALSLVCQRCLSGVEFPLTLESRLQLVAPGQPWPDEDLADDDTDAIAADKQLSLLALVEEEVLLALPIAPMHEECEPPGAARDGHELSPFAALAALKKH